MISLRIQIDPLAKRDSLHLQAFLWVLDLPLLPTATRNILKEKQLLACYRVLVDTEPWPYGGFNDSPA